ncbi:hypothetical protein HHL21_18015 [Massilia sp. RP-1-19]|uniref:DUF2793 domain-containing protein n=1 Tax=Massilia polaris TaxID=2728846 RepID=A0A848HS75_9BURK|nr:hypothetical protein [Massilia polaris]NML62939.1 hypothetical protein [Massilia polaris]
MRTPNNGSMAYAPGDPPADPAQLQRYLREELAKVSAVLSLIGAGHLDKQHAPPAKPRDGDIRYADGAQWNPGGGAGVYYYNGAIWTKL